MAPPGVRFPRLLPSSPSASKPNLPTFEPLQPYNVAGQALVGDLTARGSVVAMGASSAQGVESTFTGTSARFLGGTSGTPVALPGQVFVVRDFAVDSDGTVWVRTASGWSHLQHANAGRSPLGSGADITTSSGSAVEIDTSLRVTVTVATLGIVEVKGAIDASIAGSQDVLIYSDIDASGAWRIVGGHAFDQSNIKESIAFGGLWTGLSAGAHTFRVGWSTSNAITATIPRSSRGGARNGTWHQATALS